MRTIRGQAALEFLTTYGWAFLVILVMIGALAYFGILSPGKFLPERCSFPTELPCTDAQARGTTLNFVLTNNAGTGLNNLAFSAKPIDGTTWSYCTLSPGTSIGSGERFNATCTFAGTYTNKQKYKFLVNGTFTMSNGVYPKLVEGEIYTTYYS